MLLLALQTGRLVQTTLNEPVERLLYRLQNLEQLRELEEIVAAADGPVLADEYMGMITLQARPLSGEKSDPQGRQQMHPQ